MKENEQEKEIVEMDEEEEEATTNYFIVVWDMNGLESITDITEYYDFEKGNVIRECVGLQPEQNPADRIIGQLRLRARFNDQRGYEIYGLRSSVDEESLREAFETSPQATAKLVRSKGVSLWRGGPRSRTAIYAE